MKHKFAVGLILCMFLTSFAMVGSAGATSYDLWSLIHHSGSVTAGDKTFSGFGYGTGPIDVPLAAAFIDVSPITTYATPVGNEYGITLDSPLGRAVPIAYAHWLLVPITLTETITFNVNSSGGAINGVLLNFAGAYSGSGSASVTESVFGSGGLLETLTVSTSKAGTVTSEYAPLSTPCANLTIQDVITVSSGRNWKGSASVFSVCNQFSQVADPPSQVPVPPSLLLFAPGLFGLFGIRKRILG